MAGALSEAVGCFRRALELAPNDAVAHHGLGTAFKDQGKLDDAAACYRRALELKPDFAVANNNLGTVFRDQGKLDDAVACFRRALQLQPDYGFAHYNLGNVCKDQGKLDEAVACYRRAVELKPDHAEVHNNLGIALKEQGKLDEAIACYRRTLELKPDFALADNNLGLALKEQGKPDEAIACYRRVLELKPDYAEAYCNLGLACKDQGMLDEAVRCYRRALELKPNHAETHCDLGIVLKDQGKLDEAIACYRRALGLKPDLALAHNNLGVAFKDQGKPNDALACYNSALELEPEFAEAHFNRALLWLLCGDWQRGWPAYEWRWRKKFFAPRRFPQPVWDGTPLLGKTILLHSEQGLGDTIQFVRYASFVKQQFGGRVIVECQKPLLALLDGIAGVDHLVGRGNDLPAFDVHASLMSLPGILKTTVDTIPAQVPYLYPNAALVKQWDTVPKRSRWFQDWHRLARQPEVSRRLLPFHCVACFAPLAQVPGVRLISLQKDVGTEQLAVVRNLFPVIDLGNELDQPLRPFMDTAAVMKNLDLVVTSDSAVARTSPALWVCRLGSASLRCRLAVAVAAVR